MKKILVVGTKLSGKTSMINVVFDDLCARNCLKLTPTDKENVKQFQCFTGAELELHDSGGNFEKENMFSDISSMIFVFDGSEAFTAKSTIEKVFDTCLTQLRSSSPEASIFLVANKSDLWSSEEGQTNVKDLENRLRHASLPTLASCLHTSIYNESLFRAWSVIITSFLPRLSSIHSLLHDFLTRNKIGEILLLDPPTFLVLDHVGRRSSADSHRFEKISSILHQVKMTINKFETTIEKLTLHLESGIIVILRKAFNNLYVIMIVDEGECEKVDKVEGLVDSLKSLLDASVSGDPNEDPHLAKSIDS